MSDQVTLIGVGTPATLWQVASPGPAHLILPDGVMDLIWSNERLVFAGPDVRAASVALPPGAVTYGLRLPPGVGYALFGIPAEELVGQRIPLSDLVAVPGHLADLAHHDPTTALTMIARTLLANRRTDQIDLGVAASLDRAARAGLSVRTICEQHYLSERTLRRLSNRLFGYGPKTLASIHRFQRALRLARHGTPPAETAALAGYADQSHQAREIKRLAGVTPGRILG